jgi:hypothetical protein
MTIFCYFANFRIWNFKNPIFVEILQYTNNILCVLIMRPQYTFKVFIYNKTVSEMGEIRNIGAPDQRLRSLVNFVYIFQNFSLEELQDFYGVIFKWRLVLVKYQNLDVLLSGSYCLDLSDIFVSFTNKFMLLILTSCKNK